MHARSKTLTIRAATANDTAQIASIAQRAYVKYVARMGREPAPMFADFAGIIAAGHCLVVEDAGGIAGYLVGWPEPDAYFIENIAVDPASQGRGLGRQLMEYAIGEAKRMTLPQLRLYTNAAMVENLAIYAHMGFVETHRAVEHGYARVYMRLAV